MKSNSTRRVEEPFNMMQQYEQQASWQHSVKLVHPTHSAGIEEALCDCKRNIHFVYRCVCTVFIIEISAIHAITFSGGLYQ